MIVGEVATFPRPRSDAGQARKIIEEAYEVYDALRDYEEAADGPEGYAEFAKDALLEEVADVVTACANLAAALGAEDMRPFLQMAEFRNERRAVRMMRRDREPTVAALAVLPRPSVAVGTVAAGLCVMSACREVARMVVAAVG